MKTREAFKAELEQKLRQACQEMDARVRAGELVRAESWLQVSSELLLDEESAVELIFAEFLAREAIGQTAPPEEYYQRFPQWKERLQRLFGVDELLRDSFADVAVPPVMASDPEPHGTSPERIGPYEIVEYIGGGSMGRVYKARQTTLNRLVALKLLRLDPDVNSERRTRFRREAEIIAALQHPNIVQIHEIGDHQGQPYLSLEWVAGQNLDQMLDGKPLPARDAARLVERLAGAIHHAHEQGVVHRDLKPANILMTVEGTPKVTDFGLATGTQSSQSQSSDGQIIGTVCYMAPEQSAGLPRWSSPAVDVYALGAILYETLTGRPPFLADTHLETMRQIADEEPISPRRLQPKLPAELETICLKCLEKSPAERYSSAAALAEDLRRFLAGELILARPYGSAARTWKWAKRHPATAALCAVSALFVLCFLIAGAFFAHHLQIQNVTERDLRKRADDQKQVAFDEWNRAEKESAEAKRRRSEAEQAQAKAEEQTTLATKLRAEANSEKTNALQQLELSRETLLTTQLLRVAELARRDPQEGMRLLQDRKFCPLDLRDFAWHHQALRCRPNFRTVAAHAGHIRASVLAPDGKLVLTGGPDGGITGWDFASGKKLFSMREHNGSITALAISPDGKHFASAAADRSICLWDLDQRTPRHVVTDLVHSIGTLAFSPDNLLLLGCFDPYTLNAKVIADGGLPIWSVADGKSQGALAAHAKQVMGFRFSPNGQRLVTAGREQTIKIWDWQQKKTLATLDAHKVGIPCFTFSPDNKLLALANADLARHVRLYDLEAGRDLFPFQSEFFNIHALEFSPDGHTLAVAAAFVHLLDVSSRQVKQMYQPPKSGIANLIWSSDGGTLLTPTQAGNLRWWDVAQQQCRAEIPSGHFSSIKAIVACPRRPWIFSTGLDRTVRCWDYDARREVLALEGHTRDVFALALAPNGRYLASAGLARDAANPNLTFGEIKIWDLELRKELRSIAAHAKMIHCLAFLDDETLLSGSEDGAIKSWDFRSGQMSANPTVLDKPVYSFAPFDGNTKLVSGGADRSLTFWTINAKKELVLDKTLPIPGRDVRVVAISPSQRWLATGGYQSAAIWDLLERRVVTTFKLSSDVLGLAFSPDGKTLALVGANRTLQLVNLATGTTRATLTMPHSPAQCVTFLPDTPILVTGGGGFQKGEMIEWSGQQPLPK